MRLGGRSDLETPERLLGRSAWNRLLARSNRDPQTPAQHTPGSTSQLRQGRRSRRTRPPRAEASVRTRRT